MIKIGDLNISKLCVGDSEVSKVYLGDTEVYSSGPQPTPYKDMYLTFNIISGGTISWRATSSSFTKEIFYSINDGEWTSIVSTTAGTPINLSTGDVIKFKGDGAISTSSSNPNRFRDSTIVFEVEGNIMSLIDSTDFATATTLTSAYTFYNLFSECTGLTSAENLVLPATTLSNDCYNCMFYGCTSLTTAPELPATTLANYCYRRMFFGCTSLTTAPELPATTTTSNCYEQMFYGCTSLTTAPSILPIIVAGNNCCYEMFRNCTSLVTPPSSIGTYATTTLSMYYSPYGYMFYGCTSLTTAPELPATALTSNSYYDSMFFGCTSLTTAPELPATILTENCYNSMFRKCSSLNYIKCLATDISAGGCTNYWTLSVKRDGTFVKNPNMTSWTTGTSGIPNGWTVIDAE